MTEPNDRIEDVIGKLERAQQNVCLELRRAKSDLTVTEVDLVSRDRKIADLEREKAAALKQAADMKAALDMYAKTWMRELGPFIAGKRHEIDALVVGTRRLREEAEKAARERDELRATLDRHTKALAHELGSFYHTCVPPKRDELEALLEGTQQLREEAEKMMRERGVAIAQGQADQRALHDALGWAHEWHGKELPAPSRAVTEIIAQLDSTVTPDECGDTQGTSSFGPVRCRLPQGHDGEHTDDVTAARFLPGARTVWPRTKKETP